MAVEIQYLEIITQTGSLGILALMIWKLVPRVEAAFKDMEKVVRENTKIMSRVEKALNNIHRCEEEVKNQVVRKCFIKKGNDHSLNKDFIESEKRGWTITVTAMAVHPADNSIVVACVYEKEEQIINS